MWCEMRSCRQSSACLSGDCERAELCRYHEGLTRERLESTGFEGVGKTGPGQRMRLLFLTAAAVDVVGRRTTETTIREMLACLLLRWPLLIRLLVLVLVLLLLLWLARSLALLTGESRAGR